jgi:3'-phosphoadenosine 5'-phosphosulfate sulfotransferase (PAPS reductase)/FAD synthetase
LRQVTALWFDIVDVLVEGLDDRRGVGRAGCAGGEEYFSKKQDHVRVNAILHFTEDDTWEYIRKHNIPYRTLNDQGHRSVEATPSKLPC